MTIVVKLQFFSSVRAIALLFYLLYILDYKATWYIRQPNIETKAVFSKKDRGKKVERAWREKACAIWRCGNSGGISVKPGEHYNGRAGSHLVR